MTNISKYLSLLLLLFCSCSSNSNIDPQNKKNATSPFPKEVKEFSWQNVNIKAGMKKETLLKQIQNKRTTYGVRIIESSKNDQIKLSYGNPTGAAPGGGLLGIFFKKDKVHKIQILGYYK